MTSTAIWPFSYGQRMAYIRANDPDPGKYRLLSANLDGSDETVLSISQSTRGADPINITWSPDGKQVAYSYAFRGSGARLRRELRSFFKESYDSGCIGKK